MTTSLGSCPITPGNITRGFFPLIEMPTGKFEELPVICAQGKHPGPTLLVTANIHGGEVIGTLVLHRFFESLNLNELHGTIVSIPSLNPSGLLTQTRFATWDNVDPNRQWPNAFAKTNQSHDHSDWLADFTTKEHLPSPMEQAWANLFSALGKIKPDFMIDLHSFTTLSVPFLFLDRVWYQPGEKEKAQALATRLEDMANAIGFSVFRESSPENLKKTNMTRCTSSAFLNHHHIPAITIELGGTLQANPACLHSAVTALHNMLVFAKMQKGTLQSLTEVTVIKPSAPHRVLSYPFAPAAGIFDPIVPAGSAFKKGTVLGMLRRITGEVITPVVSEIDGYIIGWRNGTAKFANSSLGWVAAEDKMPLVAAW